MSCGVCADEGHVGEGGLGAGGGVEVVDVVVRFDAAVAEVGVLEGYKELPCTTPSKVVVKAVIASARDEDVFEIDRPSEEFDAIIFVSVDLDVFDGGSRSNGVKGDAVEFVVGADKPSCEFNTDIAQDTAAVVVVAAAVPTRSTFSETFAGAEWAVRDAVVEGCVSVKDEAAPVAWLALSGGFGGSEDNGFFAGAFGKDLLFRRMIKGWGVVRRRWWLGSMRKLAGLTSSPMLTRPRKIHLISAVRRTLGVVP